MAKKTETDWRKKPRNRENPKRLAALALHDEYRGDVKVEGTTDAPIPWPGVRYTKGRRETLLPVLCGDLVRAVCEENEMTVAHYWGVSFYMVEAWKRAISGAENANDVFAGLVVKRNDPKFRKKFGYPS